MAIDDKFEGNNEDLLPPGFFSGPRYLLSKRENHGHGYHAHVLVLNNGKYVRSGYIITKGESGWYLIRHGGSALFDFGKAKKRLLKDIEDELTKVFRNLPQEFLLPPSRKATLIHPSIYSSQ